MSPSPFTLFTVSKSALSKHSTGSSRFVIQFISFQEVILSRFIRVECFIYLFLFFHLGKAFSPDGNMYILGLIYEI